MFVWHGSLGGRVHGESEIQCVTKGMGLGGVECKWKYHNGRGGLNLQLG